MTPLERAARALFWSRGGGSWSQASQVEKDGWIKSAHCAIEEIREPSEAVVIDGFKRADTDGEVYHLDDFQRVFTGIIDAVLTTSQV